MKRWGGTNLVSHWWKERAKRKKKNGKCSKENSMSIISAIKWYSVCYEWQQKEREREIARQSIWISSSLSSKKKDLLFALFLVYSSFVVVVDARAPARSSSACRIPDGRDTVLVLSRFDSSMRKSCHTLFNIDFDTQWLWELINLSVILDERKQFSTSSLIRFAMSCLDTRCLAVFPSEP